MNAHITTPRTVSAATLARTAVLALALINQILSAAGKPLPRAPRPTPPAPPHWQRKTAARSKTARTP